MSSFEALEIVLSPAFSVNYERHRLGIRDAVGVTFYLSRTAARKLRQYLEQLEELNPEQPSAEDDQKK